MKAKLMKLKADGWSNVKFYPNCSHSIGSYYTRSGRRYTGLDKEDQERLGKELGLDLRPESEYWDNPVVRIGYKDDYVEIDTSYPEGELKYKFLKNNKRVKFGYTDKKPGAEYILIQEEESAKETNKKARIERQAISEFGKMTLSEMRKALRLYGHSANETNSEIVESTLYQLVKDNPNKFLDIWVNNKNKETQYLIEEAVGNGVLRKSKTTYKYGSDIIGYTLEDSIDYLNNPLHNDLLIAIKSRIEGKKDIISNINKIDNNKSQTSKLVEEVVEEEKKQKTK